jgi:hypothetical protein
LQPGGEARRQLADPPVGNLRQLADVAQKRHNVEQLLTRMEAEPAVGAGWLGQIGDLTDGLPGKTAGEVLWQLARKYQQTGRGSQAADALQLLRKKYPQHPLSDAAAMWLVKYYASGEVAWRERKETRFEVRLATAITSQEAAQNGPPVPRAENTSRAASDPLFASLGAVKTANPDAAPAQRASHALGIVKQIEQTRPTLCADPALRFALAAASRQAGQPRNADRVFQSLTASGQAGIWAQNAAAEQWLLHPGENAPKKICSVIAAPQKPRLDGRLDDPVWQLAKAVSLKPAAGEAELPTAAVLAYDDEFFYAAVSCRRAPGVDYSTTDKPRISDTPLNDRDRVTILLDIDRDYATCWTLTVDYRGWPAESCFDDPSWNPQWLIAAAGDAEYWTVEVAIPLAELAPAKPQVRDVWCVGLQRTIPAIGLHTFTSPAAVEPRHDAMGLLVFE